MEEVGSSNLPRSTNHLRPFLRGLRAHFGHTIFLAHDGLGPSGISINRSNIESTWLRSRSASGSVYSSVISIDVWPAARIASAGLAPACCRQVIFCLRKACQPNPL